MCQGALLALCATRAAATAAADSLSPVRSAPSPPPHRTAANAKAGTRGGGAAGAKRATRGGRGGGSAAEPAVVENAATLHAKRCGVGPPLVLPV